MMQFMSKHISEVHNQLESSTENLLFKETATFSQFIDYVQS